MMWYSQALSDPIVGLSMIIMGLSVLSIIVGLIVAGRKQISGALIYGAFVGWIIGLSGLLMECFVNMVQILSQMQTI